MAGRYEGSRFAPRVTVGPAARHGRLVPAVLAVTWNWLAGCGRAGGGGPGRIWMGTEPAAMISVEVRGQVAWYPDERTAKRTRWTRRCAGA